MILAIKNWRNMRVMAVASLVILMGCLGCELREFRKFKIVQNVYENFSLTARLKGTYNRHQKILVGDPYTLFLSVSTKYRGKYFINNLALLDEDGVEKLGFAYLEFSEAPEGDRGLSLYYTRLEDLQLEYKPYHLKFDLSKDNDEPISISVKFELEYSEKRMSKWWEDASSI